MKSQLGEHQQESQQSWKKGRKKIEFLVHVNLLARAVLAITGRSVKCVLNPASGVKSHSQHSSTLFGVYTRAL